MFYHDGKLQYPVRVDSPSPFFARMLQQALGGIEGEIRVMMQYMFQSFGSRGPAKYKHMLLETGTEEMAHIEMLGTAIALNLEGATSGEKEAAASSNPIVGAIMGGMNPRHYLSAGLAALPMNSEGVPFDMSHIYASGNLAADMYANVCAEATGRVLACRLYSMTDDPGMKDMLSFMIARDTMHQQQWLAVIEELGGMEGVLPIPNSFPQAQEKTDFSYVFLGTAKDGQLKTEGRWTSGTSLDGKGQFSAQPASPMGQEPQLAPPEPEGFAETQQMAGDGAVHHRQAKGAGGSVMEKVTDALGLNS